MIDLTNFFVLEDFESHINKTYIFNFPIEEVFKAITDRELIMRISPYQLNFHNSLNESFSEYEGSEMSFLLDGKYRFILKIIKVIKSQFYYQIKFKTIQNPIEFVPFSGNIELFWDSLKEVTIFNGQIYLSKTTSQLELISKFKEINFFLTEEFDEYLKNNVKNLEQQESILVNATIDKLWNFSNELHIIQLFINMPNTEIINEGNNILKLEDKNNKNFVRLIKREKKVEDSNYILYLESFDSVIQMPLQSMQIQLIKVNENQTLIIYKHIMLDYIPYYVLKNNSGNKQKILKKIKKLIENMENGKE